MYLVDFGPLTISGVKYDGRFAGELGGIDCPTGSMGGAVGGGVTG